jgi:hypothetical protein
MFLCLINMLYVSLLHSKKYKNSTFNFSILVYLVARKFKYIYKDSILFQVMGDSQSQKNRVNTVFQLSKPVLKN